MDIRTDLMGKIRALYKAPTHIDTAEKAAAYLGEFAETFMRMRPTEAEWDEVWHAFKRDYRRASWPVPGELCMALAEFRVKAAEGRRLAGLTEPQPERKGYQSPPYDHGAFLEAIDEARELAKVGDPTWLNLAGALVDRFDDHDQLRPVPDPTARERYGLPGRRVA